MVFEQIEQQKQELTDKYVIVTGDRPELARFEGVVGQVKTVNMSGRALVEFTGLYNNVGWFDIDPHYLRVVDKPPEETKAKAAKRPASKIPGKGATKTAADILALARGAGQSIAKADAAGRASKAPATKQAQSAAAQSAAGKAKKVSPSAGKSTADILAAARGGAKQDDASSESDAKKKVSPSVGLSTSDVLAAARGKKPAPSKPDASDESTDKNADKKQGLSTADILAAARASRGPKQPSDDDTSESIGSAPAAKLEPRRFSAADILAIAQGKQSQRREPVIHTKRLDKKPLAAAGDARPETIPEPIDTTKLTAEAIRDLGGKKR